MGLPGRGYQRIKHAAGIQFDASFFDCDGGLFQLCVRQFAICTPERLVVYQAYEAITTVGWNIAFSIIRHFLEDQGNAIVIAYLGDRIRSACGMTGANYENQIKQGE